MHLCKISNFWKDNFVEDDEHYKLSVINNKVVESCLVLALRPIKSQF